MSKTLVVLAIVMSLLLSVGLILGIGFGYSILLKIAVTYLILGVIATVIIICKEPFFLHAVIILPFIVVTFPYVLFVVFTDEGTGRWI